MKFCFELYLKSNVAEKNQWQQFFTTLTAHIGYMNQCQIIMTIKESVVRYFVIADRDLGVLSNNIDIGVLRPISEDECPIPETKTAERLVRYVPGGNLLDLREKFSLKRGKELETIVLRCRRINAEKTYTKLDFYFKNPGGHYTVNKKTMLTFPAHLLQVNFDENARYLKKEFPKYINIEKALPILSSTDSNALLAVNTFPYFAQDYYLNLMDYEFDKHSFIIGASGSGKSKFIELLVDRIGKSEVRNNYRVLIIDPHAALGKDMKSIDGSQVIDFSGDSAPELFGDSAKTDVSASTELTTTLMKSLLGDQFNPKVERVLRFSLYVLFVSQSMSLGYLKRFLTELELRNQIMKHVSGHIPPNIEQFFATDFNEIRTTHYTEAVLPIISLVDEMQLQPGLVGENELSLQKAIQDNFLTVFSLNKVSMGEKVVKTAAGILMQQIFLLAQAKTFNEKIILIVDEVSVVQNPAMASILAEARKYNLFIILTQQYFGQVEKSLKDAIYSNVYNYYVFRVSEEDAEGLIGNLNIDIPKEIVEEEHKKGIKEEVLKKRFMTELHPRECLVRVSANGQIVPVFKARTLDIGSGDERIKIAAEELEAAKPVEAPKVAKFVEGSTEPNVPTFTSSTDNNSGYATTTIINDTQSNTETAGPTFEGSPLNPEGELSMLNNPEIDPVERRTTKEQKAKKADKLAKIISKTNVKLEETKATSKVELTPISSAGEVDVNSGFGSGNLASILASQSSSREIVNKRKKVKSNG
ncbi:DUF87 domain-containing protein [Candidatus Saccharibacteria bacterium]|nr:DUF87 domain-containing protein [Candidatus Saccharibacteria bacterium]